MSAFSSFGGGFGEAGDDNTNRSPVSTGSPHDEAIIVNEVEERSQSAFASVMTPTGMRGTGFLSTLGSSAAALLASGGFASGARVQLNHDSADIADPRALETQLQGITDIAVNRGLPRGALGTFQEEGTSHQTTVAGVLDEGGARCGLCYTGDGPALDICGGLVRSSGGVNRVCVVNSGQCTVSTHNRIKAPGVEVRQFLMLDPKRRATANGQWIRDAAPLESHMGTILGREESPGTWDKFLENLANAQVMGDVLNVEDVDNLAQQAGKKVTFTTPGKSRVNSDQSLGPEFPEMRRFEEGLQDLHLRIGTDRGLFEGVIGGSVWQAIAALKSTFEAALEIVAETAEQALQVAVTASSNSGPSARHDQAMADMQREFMSLRNSNHLLTRRLATLESAAQVQAASLRDLTRQLESYIRPDDSQLIIDFFKHPMITSPSSLAPGLGNALIANLSGVTPSMHSVPNGGVTRDLDSLKASMRDLNDRLTSKSVTIGDFTFSTLNQTSAWGAGVNLPTDVDQALSIFSDCVSLAQGIGKAFLSQSETLESSFHNSRAKFSDATLAIHSSFKTILPGILGEGSDVRHNVPAAKKYSDWEDYTVGMHVGVRPSYQAGLETQNQLISMSISEMKGSFPAAAKLATDMLAASLAFNQAIINMVNEMMGECDRREDVSKDEAWLHCTAIIRKIFVHLNQVRLKGFQAVSSPPAKRIGITLWYMLQTQRVMQEFMESGLRWHPAILAVTTAHLDQQRVSLSTHAGLVAKVTLSRLKLDGFEAKLVKLEGRVGNLPAKK
jgi:hypothetical protein